jgi:AraC family transcriptional regulator
MGRHDFTMTMGVEVRQLAPMHVAYIRHVGPFQENAALFERLFGQICGWAGPRGLLGLSHAKFLSIHHDHPEITQAENLRLDMAVTVPENTQVFGEIGKQRLEGGTYAVARLRLAGNQYMEAWDTLMGGWLPGSGYQPDERPCFEVYLDDLKTDPEGPHEVEICLPVKPL